MFVCRDLGICRRILCVDCEFGLVTLFELDLGLPWKANAKKSCLSLLIRVKIAVEFHEEWKNKCKRCDFG